MACNKVKLNRDKTEFLVTHVKHRPRVSVASTELARDVRVILNFNGVMNDDHQV